MIFDFNRFKNWNVILLEFRVKHDGEMVDEMVRAKSTCLATRVSGTINIFGSTRLCLFSHTLSTLSVDEMMRLRFIFSIARTLFLPSTREPSVDCFLSFHLCV